MTPEERQAELDAQARRRAEQNRKFDEEQAIAIPVEQRLQVEGPGQGYDINDPAQVAARQSEIDAGRAQREAGRAQQAEAMAAAQAQRQAERDYLRDPKTIGRDIAISTGIGAAHGYIASGANPAGAVAGAGMGGYRGLMGALGSAGLRGGARQLATGSGTVAAKNAAKTGALGAVGSGTSAATGQILPGMAIEMALEGGFPLVKHAGKVASKIHRPFTAKGKAGEKIKELRFDKDLGEGADEVARYGREGIGAMEMDKNLAYDMAKQLAPQDATVDPRLIERVIGEGRYRKFVRGQDKHDWDIDTPVSWRRLEKVRSSLVDDIKEATRKGRDNEAREIVRMKEQLDTVYEHFAEAANAPEALHALQTARYRNRELREVVPKMQSAEPTARKHWNYFLGEGPADDKTRGTAQEVFNRAMNDKTGGAVAMYHQGRRAANRIGKGAEYNKNFRSAFIKWVATIHAGGFSTSAIRGTPTQARKLHGREDLAKQIFDKDQREALTQNLDALADLAGGGDLIKTVRTGAVTARQAIVFANVAAAVGGGAGHALGIAGAAVPLAATLATSLGGTAAGAIQRTYGKRATQELFHRAMFDESVMEELTKTVAANFDPGQFMEKAVRRGWLTMHDFAELAAMPDAPPESPQ